MVQLSTVFAFAILTAKFPSSTSLPHAHTYTQITYNTPGYLECNECPFFPQKLLALRIAYDYVTLKVTLRFFRYFN
jgi:hypothetical protein